jgi:hypothetical protein
MKIRKTITPLNAGSEHKRDSKLDERIAEKEKKVKLSWIPNRGVILGELSEDLFIRYRSYGSLSNLGEAVVHQREAVCLCPSWNAHHVPLIGNLANYVLARFE